MGLDLFMPLAKVDISKREVWGVLAEEKVDKADEVFDYAGSKPYFQTWNENFSKATDGKSVGNLRSMHTNISAGKFIQMDYDDELKRITVGAKVIDDAEWKKVTEGVYTGFSIGGSYVKRWRDDDLDAVRYIADPAEGSLVDNPCMYGATFEIVRADGVVDMRKFHEGDETAVDKIENVDQFLKALKGNQLNKAFTFDEIRNKVRMAINSGNTPYALFGNWAYIAAIYSDSVIVEVDSGETKLYRLGYTIDEDGTVTLDVQSVVQVRTEYTPVKADTTKTVEDDINKSTEGGQKMEITEENVEKATETVDNEKVDKSVGANALTVDSVVKFLADPAILSEVLKAVTADLAKAGSRNSKSDMEKIQAVHDHAIGLGACCDETNCKAKDDLDSGSDNQGKDEDTEKTVNDELGKANTSTDKADEVSELAQLVKGFKSLEKAMNDLKDENKGLVEKVKRLEALPDDSNSPVLKAVEKSIGGSPAVGVDADTSKIEALKALMQSTTDPMVKQAIGQELAVLSVRTLKSQTVMGR